MVCDAMATASKPTCKQIMTQLKKGVFDDFEIWKHKVHRARPVLCEADGYLADYRKWARQFYTNPIGDLPDLRGAEVSSKVR